MVKVLVVGQTPPPYIGQAMMIQRLVNASFNNIQILHVRMSFSEGEGSIGKFSVKKVFHLFTIIYQVYRIRLSEKKLVLYYPPAGPNLVPVLRDLVLLFFIRPFFPKTVFHFRAAGISEYLGSKSIFFQYICKKIYGNPSVGIQLSALNPKDAAYFNSRKILVIPNGLEDSAIEYLPIKREINNNVFKILFVGILREDKGLTVLVDAINIIVRDKTRKVQANIMGQFNSEVYRKEIVEKTALYKLNNVIILVGALIGKDKWDYYAKADCLCFPTYYNSESFGNVLVEAMMFQLPVIATQWRGIPDIVTEETGFLVPIKNAELLAERILQLINNPDLRVEMGEKARERFLKNYILQEHLKRMESMFLSLGDEVVEPQC